MDLVAFMENAELPTTVPARLDGKVPTVTSVFPCLDVIMVLVEKHLNATAMKVGREPIVTFPVATIVLMVIAFPPMNASAEVDGLEATVISARRWLDVNTEAA